VAEEARKPFFRVTCGDIGVTPLAVEKNLKGILQICKNWDCRKLPRFVLGTGSPVGAKTN